MSDVPEGLARDGFAEGEEDVRDTLRVLRQLAGPAFQHDRILDFGCRNGRSSIPLGRVARELVGVDLDAAVLPSAERNCHDAGLSNVTFMASLPELADVPGPFDVVHSRGVFQHIDPRVGYEYLSALLDRVARRGGGMLHVAYAGPGAQKQQSPIARRSQEVVLRLLFGEPKDLPEAMYEYDLGRLFGMLQANRFDRVATRFTEHEGWFGAKVFFWRGY
ncbi:MAG TPA: class I SAM-dependent methyltransferase [Gemmatimonadaceae bacterium]